MTSYDIFKWKQFANSGLMDNTNTIMAAISKICQGTYNEHAISSTPKYKISNTLIVDEGLQSKWL